MRAVRYEPRLRWAALAFFVQLLPIGAVAAQEVQSAGWTTVTQQRLLNPEAGDWMNYRRSYDATGFSPLDQINRTNVGELRLVWAYSMRENSRWVPTPIVANGLMYVSEGRGRVVAFDVVTGDVAWIHERTLPEDIQLSQAFGRQRGVSVYGDRIYWGTPDSYLVALDARTGVPVWETDTGDYRNGQGHSHPPLIADGKVIIGFTGGDQTARGMVAAYDANDGSQIWKFYTVPAPGEPGSESWADSELPPLGGATWGTISYDPELRRVYVGTGQPTPWASTLRGLGDALYTNSILALSIDSGELHWHFQVVPEDNWDMDSPYESMLVDLVIAGRERKALIHTSKIGWGVVLDRVTGEFIHAFRTGFDNLVTGWSETGRPAFNPELIPSLEDVDSDRVFEVCPHYHGTRNLNSPSYSSATGLYYLGINNSCMDVVFMSEEPTRRYFGMVVRGVRHAPGHDFVGEFVAFDPSTGKRAWAYRPRSGSAMTASALATGGGIVFGGSADRELFALDAATGEPLWETRLNGDISGAPVTFEVNGKQYLAVAAGGRIAQTTTFARLSNTDIAQGTGVVWVFALPDRRRP
jgi:alcohol dehydrogenase (cytochrome c)